MRGADLQSLLLMGPETSALIENESVSVRHRDVPDSAVSGILQAACCFLGNFPDPKVLNLQADVLPSVCLTKKQNKKQKLRERVPLFINRL